ncbi:NTP transferase domain-containing protein [uncultured Sphaerochaeta sp.]|uniref:NTP transferase domain-containing protein n=1 Tax=uncultured Sphaerochaeta sp. TaxID=886478 RepID=UPI002A0A11D4|nr:NTP transferase domain-containing protein [uncultured Sphaerochaeta sp.]
MQISKVGGLIAAASKKAAQPMLQIGSIPVIKRIVIAFQQAGIFPIVIVTGTQEAEVKYQLSAFGVIFLFNEDNEEPQLLESIKLGLTFLQDKCEKIVFTPVNVPMFYPSTLQKLLKAPGKIITPSFEQSGGHPVVLANSIIPAILDYQGPSGLKGFIESKKAIRTWVEVQDEGVLETIHDGKQLHKNLSTYNRQLFHPIVEIGLGKENPFFNPRCKLLLFLIEENHSVKQACTMMALSPAKAWEMINVLEQELGYPVVNRQRGGSGGGTTELSDQGKTFLLAYQQMEEKVFSYTQLQFQYFLERT